MKKITAFIKTNMLQKVTLELHKIEGLSGATVSDVRGFGKSYGKNGRDYKDYDPHIKMELLCPDEQAEIIIETIQENAHTGLRGDGKIYISKVEEIIRISDGERGERAF